MARGVAVRHDDDNETENGSIMFRWFDTHEVTEFASSVAIEYARLRKSTALRRDDSAKKSQKFAKLNGRVAEFMRTRKPNFYKKARLIDSLRTGMKEQGVPEDESAVFINSVLIAPITR